MKSKLIFCLALGAAGMISGQMARAEDKVLNVYNWAEYTAPDTIPGFERQTGIKVRYDTYDSNDTLQAKLLKIGLRHCRSVFELCGAANTGRALSQA
jgi:putrescine transport system substrate-binding protein